VAATAGMVLLLPARCAPAPAPLPAPASAAARAAAVSAAAAALRGGAPARHPSVDPSGASYLVLPLPDGSTLCLAPPVRPLPSSTGEIERDMEALVRQLQAEICGAVEALERAGGGGARGAVFREDVWTRPEGGGGWSRVLQGGAVFEKAGVNVSTVHGTLPPAAAAMMRARPGSKLGGGSGGGGSEAPPFFACGISLVLHPANPMVPSVHANYRLFRVRAGGGEWAWWFGGGADLSPAYVFPEDAAHFHGTLRAACDRLHPTAYARFKAWADAYFALPHRGGERRGVGGIFFDDLDGANVGSLTAGGVGGSMAAAIAGAPPPPLGAPPADRYAALLHAPHRDGGGGAGDPHALLPFIADAGRSFLHAYAPLVAARCGAPFSLAQREWQQLRRGRYAEFNLVHDRGTKFGLATPGARIESVLMSLPLSARWEYMHAVQPGSPEAAAEAVLRAPVEWAAGEGTLKS
jgi:coproporphyrinogen III oxidase